MKIRSLDLLAFGRFTNYSLNFEGDQGFHIIYGPNEAGKSTSMRALRAVLYGIKHDTTDHFIHPMNKMRVGALLERRDGSRLTVIRRKGLANTLLDAEETALPDSVLEQFLGGVAAQTFETFFHLDHDSLVRGGRSLLDSDGNAAESIFQAGSGFSGLHKLLLTLETETSQLLKSRGNSGTINGALADLTEANKLKNRAILRPQAWLDKEKDLKKLRERIGALKSEIEAIQTDIARLERWKLALPSARKWADRRRQLNDLGEVIVLPETAQADRAGVVASLKSFGDQKAAIAEKIDGLTKAIKAIYLHPELLVQSDSINRAYGLREQFQQNQEALPHLEKELVRLREEVAGLVGQLGHDLTAETADQIRPPEPIAAELRGLLEKRPLVLDQVKQAKDTLIELENNLQKARAELDGQPAKSDASPLQSVLARAEVTLNAKRRLEEGRAKSVARRELLEIDVKALPGWSGTGAELAQLALPLAPTIAQFQSELDGLNSHQLLLDDKLRTARQEQANLQRQIDEIQQAGPLPTEEDLVKTRAHRDEEWRYIRAGVESGLAAVTPDRLQSYETIADQADAIADTLRRESDRVATVGSLLSGLSRQEETLRELGKAHTEIGEDRQQWQERWAAQWQSTGVEVLSPAEMVSWLNRSNGIRQSFADLRLAEVELPTLEGQLDEWVQDLNRVLLEHANEGRREGESLEALIDRARGLLERRVADTGKVVKLEEHVAFLSKDHKKAISQRNTAQQNNTEWEERWEKVSSYYGPLAVVAPADFGESSVRLSRLKQQFEALRNLERDVDERRNKVAHFESLVRELVTTLGTDLESMAPQLATGQLFERFKMASEAAITLKGKQDELLQREADLKTVNLTLDSSSRDLQDLLNRAQCQDLIALELAEERSSTHRRLEGERDSAYETLLGHAAGVSVPEWVDELVPQTEEGLQQEILGLQSRLSELTSENNEAQGDQRELAKEVESDGASEVASEAAQDAANALGRIRVASEIYIQKRLSLEILRRQIEIYRTENQGPILALANPIFNRLTGGKYSALKVDYDKKDNEILLGIRDNERKVEVDTMSEGTRDQLYLALRLASLQRQLKSMPEPMPLIVDDILINFDDPRSCATLQVLGELSQDTQILFFTHHQRLVELTRTHIPQDQVRLHEIDYVNAEVLAGSAN